MTPSIVSEENTSVGQRKAPIQNIALNIQFGSAGLDRRLSCRGYQSHHIGKAENSGPIRVRACEAPVVPMIRCSVSATAAKRRINYLIVRKRHFLTDLLSCGNIFNYLIVDYSEI